MKNHKFTITGLLISYFSIALTVFVFKKLNGGPLNDGLTVIRELIILAFVGVLFWIITKKENQSLSSIGLAKRPWKETLLWSVLSLVLCFIGALAALLIIQAVGWDYGKSDRTIKLSLLTTTLVMIRAGIAEEVFFRGYIYERLNDLLKNKWFASLLSVVPFALLHYSQGLPGIFIALVSGSVLTAMYVWKRNLTAVIIAHFLIDFIPNVLIPLIPE